MKRSCTCVKRSFIYITCEALFDLHLSFLCSFSGSLALPFALFPSPSLSFPPPRSLSLPPPCIRQDGLRKRAIDWGELHDAYHISPEVFFFLHARARQRVRLGACACACVSLLVRVCTCADEMWPCGYGPCSWPPLVHAPPCLNSKSETLNPC